MIPILCWTVCIVYNQFRLQDKYGLKPRKNYEPCAFRICHFTSYGTMFFVFVLISALERSSVVAWMQNSHYAQNVHNRFTRSHFLWYPARFSTMSNSVRELPMRPYTNLNQSLKPDAVDQSSKEEVSGNIEKVLEHQNKKLDLQILLLDNYDSYTYNIYSYLSTMCKNPPIVVPNDAFDSWESLVLNVGKVDAIIISPGPGRPQRKEDMGVCLEAIEKNSNIPILGVCLGHQALGYYYNATVDLSPFGPVHGLTSKVYHTFEENGLNGEMKNKHCNLFDNIPQLFDVVRYHSLVVKFPSEERNPLSIEQTAWCRSDTKAENGDGEICMALRHKTNPHYGVQFHPESIGTGEFGYKIFKNFCRFCVDRRNQLEHRNGDIKMHSIVSSLENGLETTVEKKRNGKTVKKQTNGCKYEIFMHKILKSDTPLPSPEIVFETMFSGLRDSFWLDSSTGKKDADIEELGKPSAFGSNEGCPIISNSRFSIMGGNLGPLCKKVEYWGKDHKVEKRGIQVTTPDNPKGERVSSEEDIISFLRDEISNNGMAEEVTEINFDVVDHHVEYVEINETRETSIPFEYRGGFVGYLGYEVWHDTRGSVCAKETCGASVLKKETNGSSNPLVPTAAFMFADRSLVYDHWRDEWYLLGIAQTDDTTGQSKNEVVQWMRDTTDKLMTLSYHDEPQEKINAESTQGNTPEFKLKRSKEQYSLDIRRCHTEIKNGESYELCLTNQLTSHVTFEKSSSNPLSTTPFGLYKILRKNNPAPFAAFVNFDNTKINSSDTEINKSSFSLCCSSPERFLSVTKSEKSASDDSSRDHGWEFAPPFFLDERDHRSKFTVESKPIKGTTSRIIGSKRDPDYSACMEKDRMAAESLQKSVKDRAENLMIVDLLRNDLSRICEPGSVHVPKLMGIESFATVHQMVSTIRGIVGQKYTPIDVIAACFPGGSMTGAPKLRSVDILDELELGNSRGPYSGCLGYMSLNGSMDMNIIIRTAVVTPNLESPVENSWDVSIGAGGAITALSKSDDEFDEMLLKASAIKKSVEQWSKCDT